MHALSDDSYFSVRVIKRPNPITIPVQIIKNPHALPNLQDMEDDAETFVSIGTPLEFIDEGYFLIRFFKDKNCIPYPNLKAMNITREIACSNRTPLYAMQYRIPLECF